MMIQDLIFHNILKKINKNKSKMTAKQINNIYIFFAI